MPSEKIGGPQKKFISTNATPAGVQGHGRTPWSFRTRTDNLLIRSYKLLLAQPAVKRNPAGKIDINHIEHREASSPGKSVEQQSASDGNSTKQIKHGE